MDNKFIKEFYNCQNMDDIKKVYRQLAKRHHPDIGGNVEDMKNINSAYDLACKNYINNNGEYNTAKKETEYKQASIYKDIIEKIINIPDIDISLCGTWIWVSGNTRPHKEIFKKAGLKWASKKCQWYYRPDTCKYYNRNGKSLPFEEIKAKYGEEKIKNSNKNKIN